MIRCITGDMPIFQSPKGVIIGLNNQTSIRKLPPKGLPQLERSPFKASIQKGHTPTTEYSICIIIYNITIRIKFLQAEHSKLKNLFG